MESTLIWHKPTEPIPADVKVILIYREKEDLELINYKWKNGGVKSDFAGQPIIAWAECDTYIIAGKINENFNEEWIEFLHKNATK